MNAMGDMGSMSSIGEAALFDWPLLVCTVAIFGTAVFALLIAPVSHPQSEESARRVTRLARWLAAIGVVLSPIAFLDATAEMAGVSITAAIPYFVPVLHQTHAGRVWAWRLGASAALLAVTWLPGGARRRLCAIAAVAALMLLLGALSSHAIDHGPSAVAFYFIHEIAAATWFGGLVGLCSGFATEPLSMDWFSFAAPRVSRTAGWCLAVLVAAGCFNAYEALGLDLDHLVYAAYGRTLLCKLLTAAVVVAIGAYNRHWLVPRSSDPAARRTLVRNVSVESVLLLAVLGWSARLANTPPPH